MSKEESPEQRNRLFQTTGKSEEGSPPVRRLADLDQKEPESLYANGFRKVNSPEDWFYLNNTNKSSGKGKS